MRFRNPAASALLAVAAAALMATVSGPAYACPGPHHEQHAGAPHEHSEAPHEHATAPYEHAPQLPAEGEQLQPGYAVPHGS